MSLKEYQRKRNFRRTSEPPPSEKPGKTPRKQAERSQQTALQFVVQKHAASRLHYDFRLEIGGALKSWAVPKGPSLDPAEKTLAVHVEDHPLEYGEFEGTIPADQYGGGTVMVWDLGTWEPEGDPAKDFRRGKLSFQLHGEKLRGGWSLVRMSGRKGEEDKHWLLVKRDDSEARAGGKDDLLESAPKSVQSGRDMDEIAAEEQRGGNKNAEADQKSAASDDRKPAASGGGGSADAPTEKFSEEEVSSLPGARRAAQPQTWQPQLASLVRAVPSGDRWLHELKLDGYRLIGVVRHGAVRLLTRKDNDWTERFPTVAQELSRLPVEQAILDGEVVALREDGTSDFQMLQNSMRHGKEQSLVYYLFDLPHCSGFDLTRTPLESRKGLLKRLWTTQDSSGGQGVLRYSDHIRGTGSAVIQHACRFALEGIISKHADSHYESQRVSSWRKVKCLKRQEFVVGGYTKPSGSRSGLGALLVGYHDDGELVYAGRVGTGFTQDSLELLSEELKQLRRDQPPFARPAVARRGSITWVEPRLVAEVEFAQWTDDKLLRHASFQGLREDKPPEEVVREVPAANGDSDSKTSPQHAPSPQSAAAPKTGESVTSDGHGDPSPRGGSPESSGRDGQRGSTVAGVRLSHPQRVLYPAQGLAKRDLAEFYAAISDWILPHLVDRPLVLVRCPQGRQKECFYQKHLSESMPPTLRGIDIREKNQTRVYAVVDDLPGLISLVQLGVLEVHTWGARTDRLERPDQLVFDLDPGEDVSWSDVVAAARDTRDRLDALGLESFLRTTGGKGLHVVVPVQRRKGWDEAKAFARGIANRLAREHPDRYTATMSKAKRRGRVFIDYLRNGRGATAIASYSTRARPGAPVAVPLRWDELSSLSGGDQYGVANVPRRLSSLKEDPWQRFFEVRQSITKPMLNEVAG